MPRQTVRLKNITHGGSAIAGGQFWDGSSTPPASLGTAGLLAGYTFDYDQANRLTEFSSWADGTGTVYGYDDRGQLTSASTTAIAGITPPYGLATAEAYDCDAGSNRTGTGGVSQSATGTHNRLQTDGEYDYFFDAEGNLIRKEAVSGWGATIYDWDHRNRLIAVKEVPFYQAHPVYENIFNLYVEYIYDAFDQRIGKRVEDATGPYGWSGPQWKRSEVFVWADGQEMLRYVDSDGLGTSQPYRLASRYLWSNQVDQLLAEEQYDDGAGPAISGAPRHLIPGETLWPLTDHLGSVRDLVDNNGVNRNHVAFDSFGNRIVDQHYDTAGVAVSSTHAEAINTLFGYTGRDWDSDTELQYNRALWYDPNTGRWLSQDPIGLRPDSNPYRYVRNQPTTLTDPSGLASPDDPWWDDSGWDYVQPWSWGAWAGDGVGYAWGWGANFGSNWDIESRLSDLNKERGMMTGDIQTYRDSCRLGTAHGGAVRILAQGNVEFYGVVAGLPAVSTRAPIRGGGNGRPVRPSPGTPVTPPPRTPPIITPGSLPVEEAASLRNTMELIDNGSLPPRVLARRWGSQFKNYGNNLPGASGSSSPYCEYRVSPAPGTSGAGQRRVVVDTQTGEVYYTWTHYGDAGNPPFVRIR